MVRFGALVLAFATLVFSLTAAPTLVVTLDVNAYQSVAQQALSNAELQQLLGPGTHVILIDVSGQNTYVTVDGSSITNVGTSAPGSPDFTVTSSTDALLSLQNAHDKQATLKCLLSSGAITLSSSNFAKQLAIRSVLSSGVAGTCSFGEGSMFSFEGKTGTVTSYHGAFVGKLAGEPHSYVFNKFGGVIGFLPSKSEKYSVIPPKLVLPAPLNLNGGLFFKHPPGVLAQNPGLIYDTCSTSNNCVGPQNIFQKNPGLVGPNQILSHNRGLIGPADIAILNPNLHGAAEFAHALGIGAYSNSAQAMAAKHSTNFNLNTFSNTNRWGHNP